jgi:hypothetical protein
LGKTLDEIQADQIHAQLARIDGKMHGLNAEQIDYFNAEQNKIIRYMGMSHHIYEDPMAYIIKGFKPGDQILVGSDPLLLIHPEDVKDLLAKNNNESTLGIDRLIKERGIKDDTSIIVVTSSPKPKASNRAVPAPGIRSLITQPENKAPIL